MTLQSDGAFSQLRHLLGEPPDRLIWKQLIELLKDWPQPGEQEMAVSYAASHLDAWPHELRVVPSWYWLERLSDGRPHTLWPLFRSLSFPVRSVGDEEFTGLVESGHLANITHLDLCTQRVTGDSLQRLAGTEDSRSLHHLSLKGSPIDVRGMRALGQATHLTQLKELVLGGEQMNDAAIHALSQSRWLEQLAYLSCVSCSAAESVMIHLLQSSSWEALRSLSVQKGSLGHRWLEALIASHSFPQLDALAINYTNGPFPAEVWESWAEAPPSSLQQLQLRGVSLDDRGLASLLERDWSHLETLALSQNHISDRGALLIAQHETFVRLQSLDVGYTKIGYDGIRTLRQAPLLQETKIIFH